MNLFGDVVAHHVYRGVEWPVAAGYDYMLAGNGLFKRVENGLIRAVLPLARRQVAGLPDLRPELVVKPGLIGGHLLEMVLADARQKALEKREQSYLFRVEAGGRVRVVRPRQRTSATRVESWTEAGYENVLCELHSHNSMPAFFSDTDDRDEQGFRFYVVIGRVLGSAPEIAVRLGLYGDMIATPATAIFADIGRFVDKFRRREE